MQLVLLHILVIVKKFRVVLSKYDMKHLFTTLACIFFPLIIIITEFTMKDSGFNFTS